MKLLSSPTFLLCAISVFFSMNLMARDVSKVIYGEDARKEVDEADTVYQNWARSTAAIFSDKKLTYDSHDRGYHPEPLDLKATHMVCEDEPFSGQISSADCSSFMIGEDLMVTAGHCITDLEDCHDSYFVFDYMNIFDLEISFPEENVYRCKEIVSRKLDFDELNDYAVVKLDRPVKDRVPLKYRMDKKTQIEEGTGLVVIGNPSGLPTKVADHAYVQENSEVNFFKANLDTYGGNSGSAVFNADTGEVEGILVRGDMDYTFDLERKCNVSYHCSETFGEETCRGESVTRITVVEGL